MNKVNLIGNLTKDPDVRYTQGHDPMAVATFTIAVNRPTKNGEQKADFPRIKAFGRLAENCERYLVKGKKVGITGRIQTGSYTNKDGQRVYTTDVIANSVEFLTPSQNARQTSQSGAPNNVYADDVQEKQERFDTTQPVPSGFEAVSDDDIPF